MGLIRLFLALVVAADHWWVINLVPKSIGPDDAYKFGFNAGYAVMFFYVISGFLITYTLQRNYRLNATGISAFYRNRFVRIFSLYWPLVLLTFVLVPDMWTRFVHADAWDKFTGIFLFGMDWRLSFASYPDPHFDAAIGGLHQAWTLGAELTFYVLAPLLMRSWKIGAALLIGSFALRAYFVWKLGPDIHDIWTYHFVGTSFGFFMMGHLVCLFGRYLKSRVIGVYLVITSFSFMGFAGPYANFDTVRFWVSAVLFALSLPGLFDATKDIRWMNWAGNLSYPVYLVHTAVLILIAPAVFDFAFPVEAMAARPAAYVSLAAFLVITTLAALMIHRLIEVPVAWTMRKLMMKSSVRFA